MSRICAVLLGLALWMQMATAQPESNRGRLKELYGKEKERRERRERREMRRQKGKATTAEEATAVEEPTIEEVTTIEEPTTEEAITTEAIRANESRVIVPESHEDGVCCLHEDHFEDVERLMLKAQNGDLSLNFLSKKHQCPAEEILLPTFCCDSLKGQESAQEKNLVCTVDAWCKFLAKYVEMLGIPAPAEDWAVCSVNSQVVGMWESREEQSDGKYRAEVDKLKEELVHTKSRSKAMYV